MTCNVKKSLFSAPVRRGGMPARWYTSNVILVMLAVMLAIFAIIEFLRG